MGATTTPTFARRALHRSQSVVEATSSEARTTTTADQQRCSRARVRALPAGSVRGGGLHVRGAHRVDGGGQLHGAAGAREEPPPAHHLEPADREPRALRLSARHLRRAVQRHERPARALGVRRALVPRVARDRRALLHRVHLERVRDRARSLHRHALPALVLALPLREDGRALHLRRLAHRLHHLHPADPLLRRHFRLPDVPTRPGRRHLRLRALQAAMVCYATLCALPLSSEASFEPLA